MLAPPLQRSAAPARPDRELVQTKTRGTAGEPAHEEAGPLNGVIQRACQECEESAPRWEAKYVVNQPGDRWEEEADGAADAGVTDHPPPRLTDVPSSGLASGVQRLVAGPSPRPSRPRASMPPRRGADPVGRVLRQPGPGSPLNPLPRARTEGPLGADLNRVRVHIEPEAASTPEPAVIAPFQARSARLKSSPALLPSEVTGSSARQSPGPTLEALELRPSPGEKPGSFAPSGAEIRSASVGAAGRQVSGTAASGRATGAPQVTLDAATPRAGGGTVGPVPEGQPGELADGDVRDPQAAAANAKRHSEERVQVEQARLSTAQPQREPATPHAGGADHPSAVGASGATLAAEPEVAGAATAGGAETFSSAAPENETAASDAAGDATEERMDRASPDQAAADAAAEAEEDPEAEAAGVTAPEGGETASEPAPTTEPTGAPESTSETVSPAPASESASAPVPTAESPEPSETATPSASPEPASPPAPAATEEGSEGAGTTENLEPAESQAGLSSLAEGGGGGGEPAGGGGGGGAAIEDKPAPEAPDVSSQSPEAGLATVENLPPAKAAQALGGVTQAVSRETNQQAVELAANPPSIERPAGSPTTTERRGSRVDSSSSGERHKVEKAKEGKPRPTPQPEPLPIPPPSPTARTREPHVSSSGDGQLGASDAQAIQASVRNLPTSDPGLQATAGPAPQVSLQGDAHPAQMADQRTKLDQSVSASQAQGRRDAAQPMGEREIYPIVPREMLRARAGALGGAGSAGPTGTGAAQAAKPAPGNDGADDAVSIIAREQKGPEIKAAVAKARSEMAAQRQGHAQKVAEERTKNQQEIARAEQENASQQQAERDKTQVEVAKARGQWSQEQEAVADKASRDAEREQDQGDEKISTEARQADQQAQAHLDQGNQEAEQHRQTAETQAEQKRQEGEKESSGIFGWLASEAKAFFNRVKQGITAVFNAARKLVKAAIEKAKKLAGAIIEKARQTIVSIIRGVGAALIAIGDQLLAAFPALRDKWRTYIRGQVEAAEATVNRLAEALKKDVQKLLDQYGQALDAALGLLEKGLLAAVDVANAVVQGAIKAAKAVADAVGAFLGLIKDIASHPLTWLRNLGAGVVDGIRNHLWKAFKEAVKDWFNSKLEEVLGIGAAIWGVLKRGGIAIQEVGRMVWEGLKSAIPVALITVLVEKLVAMIVPAAGAVMVIIDGLKAAWGMVKRIIAAFGKFFAFLKAVKTGRAGPQFAEAVAAAAMVVIDFVANWLIKKLRGPASKISGKIKAMAQKIMARLQRGASRVGQTLKRAGKTILAPFRRAADKFKQWREKRRQRRKEDPGKKKQDREAAKYDRVRKAVEATCRQVEHMLQKGTSRLAMAAKLMFLKLRWGWKRLGLQSEGRGHCTIEGEINPKLQISANICFEIADRGLVNVRYEDVQKGMSLDAQMAREKRLGTGRLDTLDPTYDPNIDPLEFQKRALAAGVSRGGQSMPILEDITGGPQAVQKMRRRAALGVPGVGDQVASFGSRKIDVPGLRGRGGRSPDEVLEQHQGGKIARSILCEVTLDSALRQSHKKGGIQMTDTLARASMLYEVHRQHLGPDFELVYVVLAKGRPGDMDQETHNQAVAGLRNLAGQVPQTRIRVIWHWIPIV